jgi:hypothetical protein
VCCERQILGSGFTGLAGVNQLILSIRKSTGQAAAEQLFRLIRSNGSDEGGDDGGRRLGRVGGDGPLAHRRHRVLLRVGRHILREKSTLLNPGPMLWFRKYFCRKKIGAKYWRFLLETAAIFAQKMTKTLVFKKIAKFFGLVISMGPCYYFKYVLAQN